MTNAGTAADLSGGVLDGRCSPGDVCYDSVGWSRGKQRVNGGCPRRGLRPPARDSPEATVESLGTVCDVLTDSLNPTGSVVSGLLLFDILSGALTALPRPDLPEATRRRDTNLIHPS